LLEENIKGNSTGPDEIELISKEGRLIPVEINTSVVQRMGQEIVLAFVRDITERKRAEEALKESENKYRLLADNIHDVVFFMDMNLNYTYISPSVKLLRGYEPEEAMKHTPVETVTPSSVDLALRTLFEILETEKSEPRELNISRTLQLEMSRKDGTTVWVETKASIVRDENQRPVGIMGVTRDITERKQAEDTLRKSEQIYRELSIIDDLTQLYNSRHFYAQLEREIERANRYKQPLTLLLLDLDKFKEFNDTYGHVEGDYVLSRLGQVVKRCLRETDSAYRYGGEEFTIILPMTTNEEGMVTAQRIQTELRKESFSPALDQKVYMTVSIGLTQYKPKEEMKTFVQRVDQLMYQAKKNGRDRICPES
jgi:diguanylate cyclase (GGDEF)-like protein/PAS domain S-box-containing protein